MDVDRQSDIYQLECWLPFWSMALSVSRRLLRSFGSVLASGSYDSPSILYPSFRASHGKSECVLVVICLS